MKFLFRAFILIPLLALVGNFACAQDESQKIKVIEDIHYGEVLFYFYQQKYFSSIVHLLSAKQQQYILNHLDDAELLQGGLSLSYGMHDEAGRLFAKVINNLESKEIKNKAWYLLAKMRYKKGLYDEALKDFSYINGPLPNNEENDRRITEAIIQIIQGNNEAAISTLDKKTASGDAEWEGYFKYNLGISHFNAGNDEEAELVLGELGTQEYLKPKKKRIDSKNNEEILTLKDQANVTLGYELLKKNRPQNATRYLSKVRLESPQANKALLGIGWAYANLENYKKSLSYWEELKNKSGIDPAILESNLSVPYAYAKLGAYNQALDQYRSAVSLFIKEDRRLLESITAIDAGKLIDNILDDSLDGEAGWIRKLEDIPDTPEGRYLSHLLGSHEFHEALRGYRDLQFITSNIRTWLLNMSAFDVMVQTRQAAYDDKVPQLESRFTGLNLDSMIARRDEINERLSLIENNNDFLALANEKEIEQLKKLDRIRSVLDRAQNIDNIEAEQEKYDRFKGILIWNLSGEYKKRLWDIKKQQKELDGFLAEASIRVEAFRKAKTIVPAANKQFLDRINNLKSRLNKALSRALTVKADQRKLIETLATNELQQQRKILANYISQARYSIAQIVDRARATEVNSK